MVARRYRLLLFGKSSFSSSSSLPPFLFLAVCGETQLETVPPMNLGVAAVLVVVVSTEKQSRSSILNTCLYDGDLRPLSCASFFPSLLSNVFGVMNNVSTQKIKSQILKKK